MHEDAVCMHEIDHISLCFLSLTTGYVGTILAIDLCPKGGRGALAHFQSQGDSKDILIILLATQKCPMAGTLAKMNCGSPVEISTPRREG